MPSSTSTTTHNTHSGMGFTPVIADPAVKAATGFTAEKSKEVMERYEANRKVAEAAAQLAYETAKREATEAAAAKTALYIKIGLAVVGAGLLAYFFYFKDKSNTAHREDNPARPSRARTGVLKRSRRRRSRREKEEILHRDVKSMRGARAVLSKTEVAPARRRKKGRALTPAQRERMPLKHFVFPERRAWPIHDERHAIIALRYMQMGRGKEIDYPKIIREIKRRYAQSPKVMHALSKFK